MKKETMISIMVILAATVMVLMAALAIVLREVEGDKLLCLSSAVESQNRINDLLEENINLRLENLDLTIETINLIQSRTWDMIQK